ncbi:MAG: metal-sensitive transcriptional regulator [Fimbriimonadaceae bacterium]
MSPETRQIDRRLARIEGQIRGVRKMLEEDAYCVDVLTQLSAIRSAVNQAAAAMTAHHIRRCLDHDSGCSHPRAKGHSIEELVEELEPVLRRLVN